MGPYEIVARIGAGGMGEVWRARDTRLGRTVAVKVLPATFANDAQFRSRFEREARAIAALSHPRICTVHDVGRADSIDYFVMEYLEGQNLAERLTRGRLPFDQVLRIAIEIASGLEAAHGKQIVHRDLKPGNVMLTSSGAKLLDFGLAKRNGIVGSAANEETIGRSITEEGTILGTLHYMSPEQIEGREADARSDIFAFGSMVYEMATGRRPFEGKSRAGIIASILDREPEPMAMVQPDLPPAFEHLVAACLRKDPNERWQSVHDVLIELHWIAAGKAAGLPQSPIRRSAERWMWLALVVLLAGSWIATAIAHRHTRSTPHVLETAINPPSTTNFDFLLGPPAFSPDGRQLAVVARSADGRPAIYIETLDAGTWQRVNGTESGSNPFWYPDGHTIGFFVNDLLQKIDVAGGTPQTLVRAGPRRGAMVLPDGSVVISSVTGPLQIANGADLKRYTALDAARAELRHYDPSLLPDGRHYLFGVQTKTTTSDANEIWLGTIGSSERRLLLQANSQAVYAPPGYLLFCRGDSLFAQPFDLRRLQLEGSPGLVTARVQRNANTSLATFAVSPTGLLVYEHGAEIGLADIDVIDRTGKMQTVVATHASFWTPRLSHDGKRIAIERVDRESQNRDIWIYDTTAQIPGSRITFDPDEDSTPIWSPDDRSIAFVRQTGDAWRIFRKDASGAGGEQRLAENRGTTYLTEWSPDGRWIGVNHNYAKSQYDLTLFSTETKQWTRLREAEGNQRDIAFSPDSRWFTYASDESGAYEVYVQAVGDTAARWQISAAGGRQPRWSRDGHEIFYLAPDDQLMAVPVDTTHGFSRGAAKAMFAANLRRANIAQYDVTPDGKRFVVCEASGDWPFVALSAVQDWAGRLKSE